MTVLCKTGGLIAGGLCPDVIVGGSLCGMTGGTCAHEEIIDGSHCARCGAKMQLGKAIEQTFTGSPDFVGAEVVTMSPGGAGKLIECRKCPKCGWSITA